MGEDMNKDSTDVKAVIREPKKELVFRPVKHNGFWHIRDINNMLVALNGKLFKTKVRQKAITEAAKLNYVHQLQIGK